MKKIGILTFHYADNHGAVLQAYALRKVINSFTGYHAEIINYVPKGYGYPVLAGNKTLIEGQRRKREKFNQFLSGYCGIDSPMVHSVIGNEYDLYLVGSDQIWNTDIPEASADYEYFLPNLDSTARRAAYSASVGMDPEKIDRDLFQKYLSKFEAISLREKSYTEITTELSGKNCEYTLDPTMLLQKKDYEFLVKKPDISEEPYILYFWYDMGDGGFGSVETINTLARKYGLSVKHTFLPEAYVINHMIVNNHGHIFHAGPGEFLWYVENAQAIVTNSFHGAVFSILFGKPFYIYYPEMRKCRQENLVQLFHLQDRVIEGYVCPEQLNLEMDYTDISSILEREREKSMAYLKQLIKNI